MRASTRRVAGSASAALELAKEVRPDLVLLDVMLPDGSGFDVARELRRDSRVPIIMLTARGEEADRVAGLELGADDYVVKPFSARELVARVRAFCGASPRQANADPRARSRSARCGSTLTAGAPRFQGDELELSRKEFDLLRLLMENAGSVVTRERLIDEVWDTNWFGSTKTLDVHVSGLRKKLGDDSRRSAVHPHGARRRLPVRGVRRGRRLSLHTRLLAAFAYVLILVIVALEVPLILNVSSRVDAEVKGQAAVAAQLVAASASGELRSGATRDLQRIALEAARDSGGRVIVVDRQGRLLADSEGATGTTRPPGDPGRARRRDRPGPPLQ